ncbi:hypothetical protein F5Y17DRAFT_416871 [Xylariaceae sp. FL0594]|nr:hypothetical protein F5Y17DRAFT_416871 [Xylariaceae sp. FL0594]
MQAEPGIPSSSKRYAATEDWLKFQDAIIRLYVDENKTLEEVRQYMEVHHDFVATISMYKRQLASWHAFKNLRFDEVLQILRLKRQREAEQRKESVFFVRDRRVEPDSLQIYISRNPSLFARLEAGDAPHSDAIQDVSCRSPTPSPCPSPIPSPIPMAGASKMPERHESNQSNIGVNADPMAPPAIQRPVHEIVDDSTQFLEAYITRGFSSGAWARSADYCWPSRGHRGPSELLKSLLDRCITAALAVGRQVEPAAIRHALDAPFALLVRVFKNPPPEMIPRILCIAARLELIGRKEIQSILLQFCCDLARALYGPDHALTGFWHSLTELPNTERCGVIATVLTRCVSEFELHLGPNHSLSAEIYLLYFDAVDRQKAPKLQVESLRLQLSNLNAKSLDPSIMAMLKLEYALATCKSYLEDQQLDEAEKALSQLGPSTLPPRDESFRLVWLGYVRWIRGDAAGAVTAYQDSVSAAKRTGSRDCICEALFQLETFYLHNEEPIQAECIRAERLDLLRSLNTIVWNDRCDERPSGVNSETSDVNIVRISSDATPETWNPAALALVKSYNELHDHVLNTITKGEEVPTPEV